MFLYGIGFKDNPKKTSSKKSKVLEYVIDETVIKIGSELIWLWVAIDNKTKRILRLSISKERNMFVAERFVADLIKNHGKHPIATEMVEHGILKCLDS